MGIYDGFMDHDEKKDNQIEYSDDFYIIANHLYLNKNVKIHFNIDQYTNKFKLVNNKLDIDPNQIFINPKSLVKMDSTGNFIGSIMTDQNDKLKLNYNSDLYEDFNGSIWINLGNGLERSSDNKISIALGFATKFDNGKLSLDTSALVNNTSGTITLDPDKKRFELNYSTDMLKDYTGKIWLNLNNDFKRENNAISLNLNNDFKRENNAISLNLNNDFKRENNAISLKLNNNHFKRENDGISLNFDDSIKYDVNTNKLSSNIDKYLTTGGDIYLDNGKMKLNINNYVIDNASTIIMDTNNKLTVNITDQSAGQVYLDNQNHLKLRLSPLYFTDSSGYFYPKINYNHGFDWQNYQLNLNIDSPLYFTTNKKLSLSYNEYFKQTNDGKLDLDLNKIQTETVKPSGTGIQINPDGSFSLNNKITKLLNLSPLSGLEISVSDQLIINEHTLSRNVIRLNSNSPITRDDKNFYNLKLDRISVDFDFNTGNLKIKDGYVTNLINETYIKNHINPSYVKSIIDKNYIKDNIINESWYQDVNIFNGEELLKKYSLCHMKLNDLSMVVKYTNRSNNITTVSKIGNIKYKDIDYFECFNNIVFHYRHYSGLLFNNNEHDNHIMFDNTNQYVSYVEHYPSIPNNQSAIVCLYNFTFEVIKKPVDINSTLWESSDGKSYIKILYNNSGIVYKFNENENEVIINTINLLNKKTTLSIRLMYTFTNFITVIIFLDGNKINESGSLNAKTVFNNTFKECYLGNNVKEGSNQSFYGKMYDFSYLFGVKDNNFHDISESDCLKIHQYYKYIHNI